MGCWICRHQVVASVSDAVGTCSLCWIHACDDHGERQSGSKFECTIETAKVLYSSLVFSSPAAVPIGALAPSGLQPGLASDGWGPGSRMWEQSVPHREHWQLRIQQVLNLATADHNSPWFGREVPDDPVTLRRLADLVGLVAWYLGLRIHEPYPSFDTAMRLMREGRTEPADFAMSPEQAEPYQRAGVDALALVWLFDRLQITPAEVVYLLRYYTESDIPAKTSSDWGLGILYQRLLATPFLS